MGLTKRKDSYYVEFLVMDDGKTLTLARSIQDARLKRWKIWCPRYELNVNGLGMEERYF